MEIGQHVVCVNGRFEPEIAKLYTSLPVERVTYVIRDVRLGARTERGKKIGDVSLLLIGLINPKAEGREDSPLAERGFSQDRFRPLDEMKDKAKRVVSLTNHRADSAVYQAAK